MRHARPFSSSPGLRKNTHGWCARSRSEATRSRPTATRMSWSRVRAPRRFAPTSGAPGISFRTKAASPCSGIGLPLIPSCPEHSGRSIFWPRKAIATIRAFSLSSGFVMASREHRDGPMRSNWGRAGRWWSIPCLQLKWVGSIYLQQAGHTYVYCPCHFRPGH